MEEKKTFRPAVDWEAVENAYRAGVRSLKDIGKEFGVSDAGIIKRAKRDGWTRDLSAKIQAKADALVSEREVSAEVSERTKKAEREVIEANATMLADRVIHQRTDISRARATVQRLWAMVDAELDHPGDFAKVGELLRCEDEFGQDKLNDLYRAAIALPQQVKNAKLLADALKVLIELERKVLRIDQMPDEDPVAAAARGAAEGAARGMGEATKLILDDLMAELSDDDAPGT